MADLKAAVVAWEQHLRYNLSRRKELAILRLEQKMKSQGRVKKKIHKL